MALTAVADIRSTALRHNLQRVRQAAPGCPVLAVIKADAYGHGLLATARVLEEADAFGVARLEAAIELRRAGIDKDLVILSDRFDADSLAQVREHRLQLVAFDAGQVDALAAAPAGAPIRVWLKIDSGMGRLGIAPEQAATLISRLRDSGAVTPDLCLMTHLACADDSDSGATEAQLRRFGAAIGDWEGDISIANSAAILGAPDALRPGPELRYRGRNWVRPGLMLFGVSPLIGRTAHDCGLEPAMSLTGCLLAVRDVRAGSRVGYGGDWQAGRDSRVGVVNVGYADGYPWRLGNRASVRIGEHVAPVIGRVSMDMISIDVTDVPDAQIGASVTLWGAAPTVGELARMAGTIPYELLTGVGPRVVRRHR